MSLVPLQFTLIVTGSPDQEAALRSALRFANSVLAANQRVRQVFFVGAAVMARASKQRLELDQLASLGQTHGFSVLCCASAAQRYGVAEGNNAPSLGTLGQMIDAVADANRVITFAQ